MKTENQEAYLFDEELSLINPVDRLNMFVEVWEKAESSQNIDAYYNRVVDKLLDQCDKFIFKKCIGMKAEDKFLESKKYKKFLVDVLHRLVALEGKGKYVKEIKSMVTAAVEDFGSFRAVLNLQNVNSSDNKNLTESIEKLKKFFLDSGYYECVEGFNNGSIFPQDLFEVENIEKQEATLKFSKYHLSKYILSDQFDAFLQKMEAEKQGFSFILGDREEAAKERFSVTLYQVVYDEAIKIVVDILTHLETFVGMSEEKSKIETQFDKLINLINQVSYSLNTPDTDPLKAQTFKDLMAAFKEELKFRYSEFFDGTKEWASESLIINRSKFEKDDSEKIFMALVKLGNIDNNISAKDFESILEEGYNGKERIHWLAFAKSEEINIRLLLTFLKILAFYGYVSQEIFNNLNTINDYIKDRFVNSKGLGFTILKGSFSDWNKLLKKDSNDLKKFCNKPKNPPRQDMFNALYQILIEQA